MRFQLLALVSVVSRVSIGLVLPYAPVSTRRKVDRMSMSISRRSVLASGALLIGSSQRVPVAAASTTNDLPSIASMPSYTLLMPLVAFRSTLERFATFENAGDIAAGIEKLQNGVFSTKFFLLGVGSKYASLIAYDDVDQGLIRSDREARLQALVNANVAIDSAGKQAKMGNAQASMLALRTASSALTTFLDRCPANDVTRANRAINAIKDADQNQDGIISETEFYDSKELTDTDRIAVTWGVYGTTLLQKQLPGAVYLDVLSFSHPPDVPPALRAAIVKSEF